MLVLCLLGASLAAGQSLFDGKTLKGWSVQEKEAWMWKVKDGAIVGGSLEKKVPPNTFITTEKRYKDFELTLQVKVEGEGRGLRGGDLAGGCGVDFVNFDMGQVRRSFRWQPDAGRIEGHASAKLCPVQIPLQTQSAPGRALDQILAQQFEPVEKHVEDMPEGEQIHLSHRFNLSFIQVKCSHFVAIVSEVKD